MSQKTQFFSGSGQKSYSIFKDAHSPKLGGHELGYSSFFRIWSEIIFYFGNWSIYKNNRKKVFFGTPYWTVKTLSISGYETD